LRAALLETKRVLKPGGRLLIARDEGGHGDTGELAKVRRKWLELLKELGQPGLIERERRWEFIPVLVNLAEELKITYHELNLLEHSPPAVSPRQMAHRFRDRMYSSDWDLPEALHAEAYHRLEAWLAAEMPNADVPQTQSVVFKITILRF
jgi:SAM-dependent methyltransferase